MLHLAHDGLAAGFASECGDHRLHRQAVVAARRIGIDPARLDYDQYAETANGTVRGAAIRLDSIAIGPIAMRQIPAAVNGADMSESLLGMEFLKRLKGWRVENGQLTLVP